MNKTLLSTILLVLCTVGHSFASTVVLTWDPNAPDANHLGYKVYYADSNTQPFAGTGAKEGASGTVKVLKGTNTATLTGLDNAKPHYFAVTAYSSSAESAYSNIISIPIIPAAPVVTPVGGSKQIVLTWPAVLPSWGYNVYISNTSPVNPASATKFTVYATTYTHAGLADGAKYYYKVAALNGGGVPGESSLEGTLSAEVSATTTGAIVIIIPGIVTLKCTVMP